MSESGFGRHRHGFVMGIKERWKGCAPLCDDTILRIGELTPLFAEHKVRLAYLFGSLASSGFGNDVDIAVLMDGNNLSGLSLDLQDFLGTWRLDLVNLGSAPVRIAFEVISTGRLIHSCGADVENAFEMNVIKKYQDSRPLNSRRLIRLRENFRVGIAA